MEPGDYQDAPISKILHFIRSVDCWRVEIEGDAQYIYKGRSARSNRGPTLYSFIHSFMLYELPVIIFQSWGVKLLASINISTRAPRIKLKEQHIMVKLFLPANKRLL
jgi:hypothetical protein